MCTASQRRDVEGIAVSRVDQILRAEQVPGRGQDDHGASVDNDERRSPTYFPVGTGTGERGPKQIWKVDTSHTHGLSDIRGNMSAASWDSSSGPCGGK